MENIQIVTVSISWLIFVISVIGNITLIIALKQHFRSSSRLYIYLMLNLAAADIVFVVSSIPTNFVESVYAPKFPFGPVLCKLLTPFQTTTAMTAIFTLVTLSCQRYFMIVRPSDPHQCHQGTMLFTFLILWLLPVCLAAVPLTVTLQYRDDKCTESWSNIYRQCFTVYLTMIQYVVPLSVIGWCNGRAVLKLRRHDPDRDDYAIINATILERHNNVVRMLISIVVVFAVFWFPGQLAWIVLTFSSGSQKWTTLLEVSDMFVFANSALNPLIFFIYNGEYSFGKLGHFLRFKSSNAQMTRFRATSDSADILTTV